MSVTPCLFLASVWKLLLGVISVAKRLYFVLSHFLEVNFTLVLSGLKYCGLEKKFQWLSFHSPTIQTCVGLGSPWHSSRLSWQVRHAGEYRERITLTTTDNNGMDMLSFTVHRSPCGTERKEKSHNNNTDMSLLRVIRMWECQLNVTLNLHQASLYTICVSLVVCVVTCMSWGLRCSQVL